MKRIKKAFKIIFAILVIIPVVYFSILGSTSLWFSHHYEAGNMNIYSDSEIIANPKLVENINRRLAFSEIFNSDLNHNIYISASESKFSFFAKMTGSAYPAQGFNINYLNKIYISEAFIKEVHQARKAANKLILHSALEGDLEETICHEIIHSFVYDKLGAEKYASLPFWKQEGYAEYAANISSKKEDSLYNFNDRIGIYRNDEFWGDNKAVKDYYEAEVLVENLIERKGFTFEILMNEKTTLEYARNELGKK